MALSRRSGARLAANIWPGFVDAMTALLLVMMFVLSIFMIVQFAMRQTISGQETELNDLSVQIAGLAEALGMERQTSADLSNQVGQLGAQLDDASAQARLQASLVSALSAERDAAQTRIASFEEQVASLVAQNTNLNSRVTNLSASLDTAQSTVADQASSLETARASIADLQVARDQVISQKEAAQLALAQMRSELDQETEQARLDAARADALQALAADLKGKLDQASVDQQTLDSAEQARLVEAAAAQALRDKLQNSGAELTAMTLALEEQRQKAEDTLTLLAAAEAARRQLDATAQDATAEVTQKDALLAQANALLSKEKSTSAEAQRQVALLNQQTAALRNQLGQLQSLLDVSAAQDQAANVQLQALGSKLNAALAKVAAEQKARAELQARENERLLAEAKDLRSYRSEFFGRIREVLGDRQGVEVVGDRFVFSSEVLFAPGSADLGVAGKAQISQVASVIKDVSQNIPPEINWILRVDGHTDNTPLGAGSAFADNWELSQARALSVVKYLIDHEKLSPEHLAAAGFGEYQPLDSGDSPDALARNRRIELKLTEK